MQGSDRYHSSFDYHPPLDAHPPESGVDYVAHNPFGSDYAQQYSDHSPIHPSGSGVARPPPDFYRPPINYTISHTDHLSKSGDAEHYSSNSSILFTVPQPPATHDRRTIAPSASSASIRPAAHMHTSTSNPRIDSFDPSSNTLIPAQPAISMYNNVFPSSTEQAIMYERPFFNHGVPSSESSIPYVDNRILQAEGPRHHEETVPSDNIVRSVFQTQKAVRTSWRVQCPPGTQRTEAPLETPMSSAVAQKVPHHLLAAFKEKARDDIRQYALLKEPMRCSGDTQYIRELIDKLARDIFPKQAGECLAWIVVSYSLQQTSG